jgi:multiple antibiotic resistance protein
MDSFIKAFIALFVAMDVFWAASYFSTCTASMEAGRTHRLARQSVLTALLVSLGFTAVGALVFEVLGITVHDFKVAGGVLLFVLAVQDLTSTGLSNPLGGDTAGVVPLGVPLIVGPAVLTTILVLVEHYGATVTVAALLCNLAICYTVLRYSRWGVARLGSALPVAMSKIMSILLASIGVMMVRLGVEGMILR